MVKTKNSAGFTHVFLLAALLIVVVVVGLATYKIVKDNQRHNDAVQKERALYAKLDADAQKYIQAINEKYPGKVTHKDSCSYSSTEGGRGSLGCDVSTSINYQPTPSTYTELFHYADQSRSSLPWNPGEDITKNSQSYAPDIYRDVSYDQADNISCTTTQYKGVSYVAISVSCSGGALAEYYPVVSD